MRFRYSRERCEHLGAANPRRRLNPAVNADLGYLSNQQQFQALNFPQSVFLNQNYLNPHRASFCRSASSPSGIRKARILFTRTRSRRTLRIERDLGGGFRMSLAYNCNGGRHLNRPDQCEHDSRRFDGSEFERGSRRAQMHPRQSIHSERLRGSVRWALMYRVADEFLPPGGINPSIAAALLLESGGGAVRDARSHCRR